jgi:predicted dienelactone hydrolase
VTPAIYARLLRAWAAAGYVVAAPVFPRSNQYAPGGPDEADLINQPRDMSFVITSVLAASAAPNGVLTGLVDPRAVAVAGQSDGGSTALAAAYNRHFVDPRIKAAVILAGARIPGLRGYHFTAGEPPLLAVQGTDDDVNFPSSTYIYYAFARIPKFLLSLLGAPHLSPYTTAQPQLGIVERVSTAFLDLYLKGQPGALERMSEAGNVPSVATLTSG